MSAAQQLRQLLSQDESLVLPGVYDALGAKLAAEAGFEAVFTSGFGLAAATLGYPDYGLMTATEVLESVAHIAQSIDLPVIADLDTGYGNPLNVIRTVQEAVRSGVGGIILEDQEWPKKCGHFSGKRVIPAADQVEKLKAAIYARGAYPLLIIARTDARAPLGLAAALERGRAYVQAGADVVFVEAPQSVDELRAIATAFPDVPLLANMIEGGRTPLCSPKDLAQLGFKLVVFPLSGLFAATQAIRECFQQLRREGTTVGLANSIDFNEFEQIIDLPRYRQWERQFTPPA
uniref:2,3-dimethylmalate lyase n=1 Tax=Cyanothece sp. (strain PCC 7425 / ATCC 29141) TaxID=395961 RepID=B8HWU7_CYAP4